MNPLSQLYFQAILKQQASEKSQVKQEECSQKQNIQYLQKQQLLSLIQQSKPQSTDKQKIIILTTNSQTPTLIEVQNKITSFFQQNIVKKQPITLIKNYEFTSLPYFLDIIANLIIYGLQHADIDSEIANPLLDQYTKSPLKISMSCSLFSTIALMLRSQLVICDSGVKYLSKFLFFRDEFCELFFDTLYCYQISNGQTLSQQIGFNQILQLVKKSQDDVWTTFIYKMLSEQSQKLSKDVFLNQFNKYTNLMNNFFKKNNLIMDVVENNVKQTQQLHNDQIFQEYLLIMGSFKATTQDFLKKALSIFFEDSKNELDLIQFSSSTLRIHKSMNCQILYILPQLMQLESQLLDHINTNAQGEFQPVKNSSNYYLKMIEKLKNKCVYNGEDSCNCKKCQCIRRNRHSAKESQKKKREALEKIGPLQDQFDKLLKKVKIIEDENEMLRQLLIDVFKHPDVQKISSQFIEPLTKVIQDDQGHLSEC